MLIIRKEQMQTLRTATGGSFEKHLVSHFQHIAHERTKKLGEEGLRRVINYGMERADNYNFTMRGSSRFYVETMFILGSDFDTDPQYPWAYEILAEQGINNEIERADALHVKLVDYTSKTSTPELLHRSMLSTRELLGNMPSEWGEDFEGAMLELASGIHPEKYDYVGEEQMLLLLEDSENTAAYFDLGNESGICLIFGLSFALGYCCAFDPLFPWIENSLKQSDADTSYNLLLKQSETYLNRALINYKKDI